MSDPTLSDNDFKNEMDCQDFVYMGSKFRSRKVFAGGHVFWFEDAILVHPNFGLKWTKIGISNNLKVDQNLTSFTQFSGPKVEPLCTAQNLTRITF